ncbi:hypothetical protein F5Y12DRAFT_625299 [Xylaria sp. FL1777]|nr:hypothetical protein F5Y12DRAFT_625299 [Xylaria sp. FL1777]
MDSAQHEIHPNWYNQDQAPQNPLPSLSTFLALEKLNNIRQCIHGHVQDTPVLEAFLMRLLEMLYDLRFQVENDIHARLRNDSEEARVDIWIYRPVIPFKSNHMFTITEDFLSKMIQRNAPELPMAFRMCWRLREIGGTNVVERAFKTEPGGPGQLDLFRFLARFPRSTGLDLGWIQLPDGTGTPDDEVENAYKQTLNKQRGKTNDSGQPLAPVGSPEPE